MKSTFTALPMLGEAELLRCDPLFDHSNDDLFEPGTGSTSSFGSTTSIPATASTNGSDGTNNSSTEDNSRSFPSVLHAVVSNDSHCIHWTACGTRFMIADKEEFSKNVLPLYFDGRGGTTTKFTSFTRRLKRWNFSRVPSGCEMGAYFHSNFRRGQPKSAENLIYPINRYNQLPPVIGGNKGQGKPAISKALAFPNERRRASTGSIVPSKACSMSVTSDTGSRGNISPTPIRAMLRAKEDGSIFPLPILASEMKTWLSSVDFVEDGGLSMNNYAPGGAVPASVISSTTPFLPPPPFPNNVMSGGCQQEVSETKPLSMLPAELVRRHSMIMNPGAASMMSMQMMTTSRNDTNTSVPSQLLGVSNPRVAMSAVSNTSFGPDNHMPAMDKKNTQPKGFDDASYFIDRAVSTNGNLEDSIDLLSDFCSSTAIDPST